MQVSKIGQQQVVNRSNILVSNGHNNCFLPSYQNSQPINSAYGTALVSFGRLSRIPVDNLARRSAKDIEYLKTLASDVGCLNFKNLKSIIGIDEFKALMKKASKENFDPKSEHFMINTHNHTLHSDGEATVKEILDEAQQRGEKSGKNFLVGITDHDTLNSAREAIELVSKNPEQYKNVRLMIGVEPCVKYENPAILKMPIPLDAVAYCINPNNKIIRELFEKPMDANRGFAREAIKKINEKWGTNETLENAYGFNKLIKTGGSTGFLKYVKKYMEKVLKDSGKDFKPEEVLEIFKPYYANQSGRATIATTDIKDARKLIIKSGQGDLGPAHLAIIEFNPEVERVFDYTSRINLQDGVKYNDAIRAFLKDLSDSGFQFAEGNYQYPKKYYDNYPEFAGIKNVIDESIEKLKMIKTGGTDSHINTPGEILSRGH